MLELYTLYMLYIAYYYCGVSVAVSQNFARVIASRGTNANKIMQSTWDLRRVPRVV